MEVPSEPKSLKKSHKKRKASHENGVAIVRPEFFDGMTNWLKLQQVLEKTKENEPESSLKSKERKTRFKKSHKKKREYKRNPPQNQTSKTKHLFKFDFDERLTKTVSLDCEMVGVGPRGCDSILARVSIVNAYGECIYDTFVKPKEKVTDYRTFVSGVRPSDLVDGKDLLDVQKDVLAILEGRRLVGHSLRNDFAVLFIDHPRHLIRDTSKYAPFKKLSGNRTPSLKSLAAKLLGCEIQGAEHNSIEDAQAAMLLYLNHKNEWEKSINQWRRKK
ncbi:RNA exonuclease 4 [Trichonephila inaurata madagascariensis]|uniref:RNA exonuclease 4 n=1 Tax=Trichonephila inaurata madagascariensis TaxID=2747483 RepID=A0A8X6YR29_9ARAC|nr:RNA exonuclease 4 [Trichonephila inaurata madagascariensis]